MLHRLLKQYSNNFPNHSMQCSFKTSVSAYKIIWCHNPEDHILNNYHCEILSLYMPTIITMCTFGVLCLIIWATYPCTKQFVLFFQFGWTWGQHQQWMQYWKLCPTKVWIIWSLYVDCQSAHTSVLWSCSGLSRMFVKFDRQ